MYSEVGTFFPLVTFILCLITNFLACGDVIKIELMVYNFVVSISGLGYLLNPFRQLIVGLLDITFETGHICDLNSVLNIGRHHYYLGFNVFRHDE